MDVISLRRDFHKHPEEGFTEFRTASIVIDRLKKYGFKVSFGKEVMDPESRRGLPAEEVLESNYQRALRDGANPEIIKDMRGGFTGVVGVLEGENPGPTVAFRFDMDALPIYESSFQNHYPKLHDFRSVYDGSMHACGHDAHTAIGLALAEKISQSSFNGKLKLVFQPAEEGGRGAYAMVKKGVLDDVDKFFGMHLGLGLPSGKISGGSTNWLAVTKYLIHFYGKNSHSGLFPEEGRSALLGASNSLLNIHAMTRFRNAETRASVGLLEGGTASNVIPDYAKMLAETRASDGTVLEEMDRRFDNIIKSSALMYELDYKIDIVGSATTIECDEKLVNSVIEVANDIKKIEDSRASYKTGCGEDASLMIKHVQKNGGAGTYIIVGSDIPASHHNSEFDIDEEILPVATKLLFKIAIKELSCM